MCVCVCSDTGADAPESCIFTLVCSIGGILGEREMIIGWDYVDRRIFKIQDNSGAPNMDIAFGTWKNCFD